MSEFYTKQQSDAQASVIGSRIKSESSGTAIASKIDATNDVNYITDAERAAIALIEPSKFLGTFATLQALNTAHAATGIPGQYATLTNTNGPDTEATYDVDAAEFIDSGAAVTAETAASVKTKYESNPNTNAFTDAEKTKLADITEAADISAFTAALDAALV